MQYSYEIQRAVNAKQLDVVFVIDTDGIIRTATNFSDYFKAEYNENRQVESITLQYSKDKSDLEGYFLVHIPENVQEVMVECLKTIK